MGPASGSRQCRSRRAPSRSLVNTPPCIPEGVRPEIARASRALAVEARVTPRESRAPAVEARATPREARAPAVEARATPRKARVLAVETWATLGELRRLLRLATTDRAVRRGDPHPCLLGLLRRRLRERYGSARQRPEGRAPGRLTLPRKYGKVVAMKTTLEIPDDLFRQTKAVAALRGESLKDFVTEALQAHLERQTPGSSTERGWRTVFGRARREDVEPVDTLISEEFEHVELDEWR